jgi:hypothetical protein
MSHKVKCLYCGKEFDRDEEEFVKFGNRYGHKSCFDEANCEPPISAAEQEKRDLEELKAYIRLLFKKERVPARANAQIQDYHSQGYTYSGMLKCLKYFYEIKGGDKEKAYNGIGIVPYIWQEAYSYYYTIAVAHELSKKEISFSEPVNITIEKPKKSKRVRLFSMEDSDE